jgi:hypothetical protein
MSPKIPKYWYFTMKISVFSAFGGYGLGYGKSDHSIGHSSSICTWNKHGKFGTTQVKVGTSDLVGWVLNPLPHG